MDPLEQVWTCREDTLYPRMFGSPSRGLFPLEHDMFAQLDSGRFDFLHIVGITEQERDYAKANGTDELVAALRRHGAYPVTVPGRASIPL